jgi:N-carbamoyl-L-amino-acid hydrolase
MKAMQQQASDLFDAVASATRDTAGVTRESYGHGEERAMAILEARAAAMGLHCHRDPLQNLWIELPGDRAAEPCIVIGSHVDSVPQGGNFDGLAGVVAGLLVLQQIQQQRLRTRSPVRVLAIRGEESAWYGKAYVGSSALLGRLDAPELENRHRSGEGTLAQAMRASGVDMARLHALPPLLGPHNVAAFLELHIEQGPVMVARQWPVAAVTGIRGNVRHNTIRCLGEAGHSGAVPRWLRKDALLAVAELLSRLDEHWRVLLQMGVDMVMTVGVCSTPVPSHAVSVIPGSVQFSFEVRSQDAQVLERFYALMRDECSRVEQARGVRFEFDRRMDTAPAAMDEAWQARLVNAAARSGLALERMPSGAGHDAAMFANAGIPAGMLFIRNEHGSHNPAEAMAMADFLLGTQVLLQAVAEGG